MFQILEGAGHGDLQYRDKQLQAQKKAR